MRFADVMDGNAPPLEVRLDLRPGDRVGLYEEVRHPSMGAGLSPVEAVVLGSPEPGWFVGQTEDGQEITFHAGNVADVQMGSPEMGGIFDWFKRLAPPVPGSSMIPAEQLPALPARPEERKGLIAKFKEAFAAPFEPMSREMVPATEKKSIFDFFKKPTAGLPAERAESGVTPYQKKPSMFSFLDPEAKGPLTQFFDKAAEVAFPNRPGPLAPYIEKALEPFIIIPKSPEPEPFEAKQARQMQMWSGMFEKEPEVKVPISKMFEMFAKEEIQPYEEVIPPEVPKNLHRSVKVLPMPRRQTLLPSLEEVARGFMGFYNPISELWDTIRQARNSKSWKQYLEQYGYAKEPLESLGNCGGPPDIFMELAAFLHIPWEEFRNRAEVEERDDEEEWINDDLVWMEIVIPAIELMTQALDMMRPEDIPGHFIIEKGDDHGCMLIITYVEGEEKEGSREEWEENQEQRFQEAMEEQEENDPQEIAEALEKGIEEEEETILRLTEELENLSPDNEEFKEISKELKDNLKEAKAALRTLTEELSDLPGAEAPRRAPAKKKKPAKRGGKKKKGK